MIYHDGKIERGYDTPIFIAPKHGRRKETPYHSKRKWWLWPTLSSLPFCNLALPDGTLNFLFVMCLTSSVTVSDGALHVPLVMCLPSSVTVDGITFGIGPMLNSTATASNWITSGVQLLVVARWIQMVGLPRSLTHATVRTTIISSSSSGGGIQDAT